MGYELLLLGIGALGLLLVLTYNGLITKRNAVDNAFGAVQAELKRRHDLIPNLVEAVKRYMAHEKEILERLVLLREQAEATTNLKELSTIEAEIGGLLRSIRLRAEAYPDLKANANFLQLQGALTEVESSLVAARRFYNAAVTDYNNAIQQIPGVFLAPFMGMRPKEVFQADPEEAKVPNLKDLF